MYYVIFNTKRDREMAEMDRLINVYSEILTLYREGKEAYNTQSFHGMTVDDNNRLNEKIICEFLAKLGDYVPEFTAARNYKNTITDKENTQ